jgi:hypothetical protein
VLVSHSITVKPPEKPSGYEVDWPIAEAVAVLVFAAGVVGGLVALLVWLIRRAGRDAEISRARAGWEAQQRAAYEAQRYHEEQAARVAAAQADFDYLEKKYGAETAGRIMKGEVWIGAPAEAVLRAKGKPDHVDEIVKKSKVEHVLKYGHRGADRYALRYYIEDGEVSGWEDKT